MAKCLAFNKALLQHPLRVWQIFNWMLDADGLPSDAFTEALADTLLVDAAKLGWFLETNSITGYLELVRKIPLTAIGGATMTAGALVVGQKYLVSHFETDDDFSNVGATNADGNIFVASGTTPTTWTNGSILQALAASGDYIINDGTDWAKQTPFYGPPTVGGPQVPAATAGELQTAAHGLGTTPKNYRVFIECNSADADYAVGDRVDAATLMFFNSFGPEHTHACTIFADAAVVGVVFRNGGGGTVYRLFNKSTQVSGVIDPTKWNTMFYAMP